MAADGGQVDGGQVDGGQMAGPFKRAALVLLALLALALPLVVLSLLPVTAARADIGAQVGAEVSAERAQRLAHILTQDCGSCHGLTMKGGLGSPLTPDALSHATPEGLAFIILEGIPGTAMPPWRALLSEGDALWIAEKLLEDTP